MNHSSANVTGSGDSTLVGGLVGYATAISLSYATGNVSGGTYVGGLAGETSEVDQSFATGDASGHGAGGLAGALDGPVTNSYALGAAHSVDENNNTTGGLIAVAGSVNGANSFSSYSAGRVTGGKYPGGFVGSTSAQFYSHCYWDINTSGTRHGAGNAKKVKGIKGETTAELKAGLPDGFDPNVWAIDPNINDGYPYLIANPPPGDAPHHAAKEKERR